MGNRKQRPEKAIAAQSHALIPEFLSTLPLHLAVKASGNGPAVNLSFVSG